MITDKTNKIIRFEDGSEIYLEDFFNSNYLKFNSFAFNYLADKNECEDIVQDVFMSFWEQKKTFPNLISIKAYFYTSIRNMCLNSIKHDLVKQKYFQESKYKIESTEFFLEGILRKEANGIIYDAINKLPLMEKKVLLLSLKECSNEQIANELNIKINTVKTHKSRAYQVLRKKLGNLILTMITLNKSFFYNSAN
ncbi:RNA polymerase sigma-70 factor [Mariniphaga sediminis]|jgi:RNA polymerase sigma-70 factor (ECF subfamily)|uniref:RNA polymerase sigma-70 factor n=1 Tax=Mariniphaga sediminis TaxID=1628158 RepID=A0A399CV20_9BACT|nr:RNA polymerase sigma-70 factor [Mariniphaga sediminis]RIH63106.1 RNA polymerase sigma-70 factor [Mariniphaga sediminis]